MKSKAYILKLTSSFAVCAVLFLAAAWEAPPVLTGGGVVYADMGEADSFSQTVEVTARPWNVKETLTVSGGPASVPLMIAPSVNTAPEDEWKLLLVNKENPLPENYQIETQRLSNGLLVDTRIYDPLMELLEAGNKEGCALMVCSAYRSYERQVELYEADVAKYQSWGYSYEEACARTEETLAVPGRSEHQSGLAVDIVTVSHQVLNAAFADTKAGRWLAEHAHEYGFILRYPEDKEDITGIAYEPWHFRYVGREAAAEIYALGCCLEEYIQMQNQLCMLELTAVAEIGAENDF